jgi:hypothetical protein
LRHVNGRLQCWQTRVGRSALRFIFGMRCRYGDCASPDHPDNLATALQAGALSDFGPTGVTNTIRFATTMVPARK